MLNIGFGQLIIILMIAVIVVGPQDLPKVARWLGRSIRYVKEIWIDILKSIDIENEARDLRSVKQEIDNVANSLKPQNIMSPIKQEFAEVSKVLKNTEQSLNKEIKDISKEVNDAFKEQDQK